MSVENFKGTMLKMKEHYSLDAKDRQYASIEELLGPQIKLTGKVSVKDLPQDAQSAITDYQGALNVDNGDRETQMTNGVSEYQADKDQQSFKDKMNQKRDQDKAKSSEQIDSMYDRLITAGEQHPESQSAILEATSLISDFASKLWGSFTDFVTNLVTNIVQWVSEAFDKIKNWVGGAVDSVSNFFSGLFS